MTRYDVIETDGGDPIDKNPSIADDIEYRDSLKLFLKQDFKVIMEWMEKRLKDYARTLSREELQQLIDYVYKLRMEWSRYNDQDTEST